MECYTKYPAACYLLFVTRLHRRVDQYPKSRQGYSIATPLLSIYETYKYMCVYGCNRIRLNNKHLLFVVFLGKFSDLLVLLGLDTRLALIQRKLSLTLEGLVG
jgi:hypothetical protein